MSSGERDERENKELDVYLINYKHYRRVTRVWDKLMSTRKLECENIYKCKYINTRIGEVNKTKSEEPS